MEFSKTQLNRMMKKIDKDAKEKRQWALIGRASALRRCILRNGMAGSPVVKAFALLNREMARNEWKLPHLADLARKALDAFIELPEKERAFLQNGWKTPLIYPDLAEFQAWDNSCQADVEWRLSVSVMRDKVSMTPQFEPGYGACMETHISIRSGATKAEALAELAAAMEALKSNWAQAIKRDNVTVDRQNAAVTA